MNYKMVCGTNEPVGR